MCELYYRMRTTDVKGERRTYSEVTSKAKAVQAGERAKQLDPSVVLIDLLPTTVRVYQLSDGWFEAIAIDCGNGNTVKAATGRTGDLAMSRLMGRM